MTNRIRVETVDGVTVVTSVDKKLLDFASITELGDELFALVEQGDVTKLVFNFIDVTFLSSLALNKLIRLDKHIKAKRGKLKLCGLCPEVSEVFWITQLNQLFDIKDTLQEALEAF